LVRVESDGFEVGQESMEMGIAVRTARRIRVRSHSLYPILLRDVMGNERVLLVDLACTRFVFGVDWGRDQGEAIGKFWTGAEHGHGLEG